jgi:DNA-binding response OmpR family regulator
MIKKKVLVISADDSLTHSVLISLSLTGYNVIHTPRGIEAIDLIKVEKPSLIILDKELPDYSSLTIIRALRSDKLYVKLPVILMGSNMREKDVLIGLEVGADLCLLETFNPLVFVARVRSLLRRSEQ